MAVRRQGLAHALRAIALDPWRNLKSEAVQVPEWDGCTVVLRALTVPDWVEYNRRALLLAPRPAEAAEDGLAVEAPAPQPEAVPAGEHGPRALYAFVLARALHDEARVRVFSDDDVPELAATYAATHDRLCARVFALSAVPTGDGAADPVTAAGNA